MRGSTALVAQGTATANSPVAAEFQSKLNGLSEREAARRLAAEGFNELPRPRRRNLWRIALEVFKEPMVELLLAASVIYLLLGSRGEALMLIGSAIVTVTIAIVQESRTERVLEALRDLTSPRALVVRGGRSRRIPGREVVRGDIVVLAEGDRVPADATLLSSAGVEVDESLLTGESVPIRKRAQSAAALGAGSTDADEQQMVFSATMIVRGHGIGEVQAIGAESRIGRIGKSLGEIAIEPSALQLRTRRFVRVLAIIGIALSSLVAVLYILTRGSALQGLLAGITLAMSLLPEEFPLVLTIFVVIGAWRISKARVLTRRSATIETLGSATVLCADKTGTLTANRMSISALAHDGEIFQVDDESARAIPDRFLPVIEFGILASEAHPFDPMERAFHEFGREHLAGTGRLHPDWLLAHDYGLKPELPAAIHVWKPPEASGCPIAAKGAPETIAQLCRFGEDALRSMVACVERMAERGMRVLAVANGNLDDGALWPESPRALRLDFVGLVGLADPLRPGVAEAVNECRSAGIQVVMITGDYPATARAIAEQAGLDLTGGVVTGAELAQLNEEQLRQRVKTVRVFARTQPEQKLRLVNAFRANGEIVAMTGDGVNDAPSLRAADIGIAMGGRGTDVAREASAIVLLDDDFASIVKTIKLGRRIYDNLRKAIGYLLAVHVPIAGLSLLPVICGWPLLLTPVHIAFLELVIDPVASIVFEAETEERNIMRRPPRDPHAELFSIAEVWSNILEGLWVFALSAAVLTEAMLRGRPEVQARALTFVSLVTCNFVLIFVNRSFSSSVAEALGRTNSALWLVLIATVVLLAASLTIIPVRSLFEFGPLGGGDFARIAAVGLATFGPLELVKALRRAKRPGLKAADARA